jgi:hypothetical protein
MKSNYFTTGRIYIYSIFVAAIDTVTISRDEKDFFNFEVLSLRIVGVFSYWLIVKSLADFSERKGYSYKAAMILGILGIPALAGLLSLLLPKIS